jgi:hypothetical protein
MYYLKHEYKECFIEAQPSVLYKTRQLSVLNSLKYDYKRILIRMNNYINNTNE